MKPNIHTDIHCLSFWISSDLLLSFLKDLPFLSAGCPVLPRHQPKEPWQSTFSTLRSAPEYEPGLRSKHKWLSVFIKPCLSLECSLRLLFAIRTAVSHQPAGNTPGHQTRDPSVTAALTPSPGLAKAEGNPLEPPEHRRGLRQPGASAGVSKRTRERDGMV